MSQIIQLYCRMQHRLGAMDRLLGALTHRGIIPARMASAVREDGALEMLFSFAADAAASDASAPDNAVEKLVKFLRKQVYVLEVRAERLKMPTEEASNVMPLFVSDVLFPPMMNETAQRRVVHAHHA